MAKTDKKAYAEANLRYLDEVAAQPGVERLAKGVLYKVEETGSGRMPTRADVVSVYYRGSLTSGHVFDDNFGQGYPDAFRLSDLIVGWQIALTAMHEGDRWIIYVPADVGYGRRSDGDIPGGSTLIFDIKLVRVN